MPTLQLFDTQEGIEWDKTINALAGRYARKFGNMEKVLCVQYL